MKRAYFTIYLLAFCFISFSDTVILDGILLDSIRKEAKRAVAQEEYAKEAKKLGVELPLSSLQPSINEITTEAKRFLEKKAAETIPMPNIDEHLENLRPSLPLLKRGEFFRYTRVDGLSESGRLNDFDSNGIMLSGRGVQRRMIPDEVMARVSDEELEQYLEREAEKIRNRNFAMRRSYVSKELPKEIQRRVVNADYFLYEGEYLSNQEVHQLIISKVVNEHGDFYNEDASRKIEHAFYRKLIDKGLQDEYIASLSEKIQEADQKIDKAKNSAKDIESEIQRTKKELADLIELKNTESGRLQNIPEMRRFYVVQRLDLSDFPPPEVIKNRGVALAYEIRMGSEFGEQAILYTTDTLFSSTGIGSLHMEAVSVEHVRLKNMFTNLVFAFIEVDVDPAIESNLRVDREINRLQTEIERKTEKEYLLNRRLKDYEEELLSVEAERLRINLDLNAFQLNTADQATDYD